MMPSKEHIDLWCKYNAIRCVYNTVTNNRIESLPIDTDQGVLSTEVARLEKYSRYTSFFSTLTIQDRIRIFNETGNLLVLLS